MEQPNKDFKKYQGLTVYYAKRHFRMCKGFGYSTDEVITWAFEALWKICINRKNFSVGEFKNYLSIRIRGEIIDNIRKDQIKIGSSLSHVKMTSFTDIMKAQDVSDMNGIEAVFNLSEKVYMSDISRDKDVYNQELYDYITKGLDDRCRYIIKQRIFIGLNMYQISKKMNLSPQTLSRIWTRDVVPSVKSKLHRLVA